MCIIFLTITLSTHCDSPCLLAVSIHPHPLFVFTVVPEELELPTGVNVTANVIFMDRKAYWDYSARIMRELNWVLVCVRFLQPNNLAIVRYLNVLALQIGEQ